MNPDTRVVNDLLAIIDKYGGAEEINRKAKEAGKLENLLGQLEAKNSPYLADLNWLIEQRDNGAFISISDYKKKILGDNILPTKTDPYHRRNCNDSSI